MQSQLIALVDARTKKWTTFDSLKGLSGSDSKLYTNFEIFESQSEAPNFENILIYKAKELGFTKTNFKKLYIL